MKLYWLILALPLFSGCKDFVDKVKYVDKIVFKKIPAERYYGGTWDENGGDPDLYIEFVSTTGIKEKAYQFTLAQDVGQNDLPYTYVFTDNSFPLLAKEWNLYLYDEDYNSYAYRENMANASFGTTGKENPIKLDFYDGGYEVELYYVEK